MMDEKILNFFRKYSGNYLSGEEISKALGVSRTAVWKHIENLRGDGYDIAASPHLGYKLISAPDRLTEIELKSGLKSKIIGRKIYSYKEVASTNDTAYSLAMEGEKEGAIIIAEHQNRGRGRLGRKWVSPKGKGAYFSVVLRPDILPREVSLVTLISSLAIAKVLRECAGIQAFIKWPNDILVRKKKICGILTELNGETDKINFVIVGIGININTKKEALPEIATSVSQEKGEKVSRLCIVKRIFESLDKYYRLFKKGQGVDNIMEEYKTFSAALGKRVKVSYHNRDISGQVYDIDKDGALLIRGDSGFTERILAGDVTMLS